MFKWQRTVICVAAVSTTSVLFINFCNMIFRCGCTWLWAGAADHCNIHYGVRHCPWCASGMTGYMLVWLGMVVPQGLISFWPAAWSWPLRLTLALFAFPVAGIILAVPLGVWMQYWN